ERQKNVAHRTPNVGHGRATHATSSVLSAYCPVMSHGMACGHRRDVVDTPPYRKKCASCSWTAWPVSSAWCTPGEAGRCGIRPVDGHRHVRWKVATPPATAEGCQFNGRPSLCRRYCAKRCCWTDLEQVLCQRSTRLGARPPWRVVSRPGLQGTRSVGNAAK